MLRQATEKDRRKIIDYCLDESTINLFLLSDLENFGFDSTFQDVWIENDPVLKGIVLRYHTMLIVYSKHLDMNFMNINDILEDYAIKTIAGKSSVVDKLVQILDDNYNRSDQVFAEVTSSQFHYNDEIVEAAIEDALEIAEAYGKIPEFKGIYSDDVKERETQIKTRIQSQEGKHFFIKDDKGIVTHGNTTAENSHNGMIGGVFTRNDQRNKGYATLIINHLLTDLLERKKTPSVLYKREMHCFYEKFGFREVGQWSTLGRD